MRHNNDPSYTGEVYHTPQYKINALSRKHGLNTDAKQASSDYIYEDGEDPRSNTFNNYHVENDDYVLPPQDRKDAPEVRPQKSEKGKDQDIYDEDHYTLARNSGFEKDFGNSAVNNSCESKNKPCKKMIKCTHMIIICLIIALLGIGGVLAYVMIERKGRILNQGLTCYRDILLQCPGNNFKFCTYLIL